jgi:hypothetical protein
MISEWDTFDFISIYTLQDNYVNKFSKIQIKPKITQIFIWY